MNEDGSMARLPDLIGFAQLHGLKIGTISDLISYRRRHDNLVRVKGEELSNLSSAVSGRCGFSTMKPKGLSILH